MQRRRRWHNPQVVVSGFRRCYCTHTVKEGWHIQRRNALPIEHVLEKALGRHTHKRWKLGRRQRPSGANHPRTVGVVEVKPPKPIQRVVDTVRQPSHTRHRRRAAHTVAVPSKGNRGFLIDAARRGVHSNSPGGMACWYGRRIQRW